MPKLEVKRGLWEFCHVAVGGYTSLMTFPVGRQQAVICAWKQTSFASRDMMSECGMPPRFGTARSSSQSLPDSLHASFG